jgi:drug/metabolite transporter (DMT)-like permease
MKRLHADLLLLLVAAVWGFGFLFQKQAMSTIGPLAFIAARSVLAALALAPLALRETRARNKPVEWQFLRITLLGGGAFFLGASLQQQGLITATVTNAGFLTGLYVVLIPFMMWVLMRRAPAPIVWASVLLSFAGVWLLGGGSAGALSEGDILVSASAVFWALHVVITGLAARYNEPALFTCLQFWIVSILGFVGALVVGEPTSLQALSQAWKEIAYIGFLSSAFTFTILIVALRYTTPAEAGVIISTESLFAALGGALVFGERLEPVNWLGAALIVAATLLVQLAPQRAKLR